MWLERFLALSKHIEELKNIAKPEWSTAVEWGSVLYGAASFQLKKKVCVWGSSGKPNLNMISGFKGDNQYFQLHSEAHWQLMQLTECYMCGLTAPFTTHAGALYQLKLPNAL